MQNPNLAQLPNCGHLFHEDCLKKWDCFSCPICRTKVSVNRRSLIMEGDECKRPQPIAVPLNQLNLGPTSRSGSSDPSNNVIDNRDAVSMEEVKVEMRKSIEDPADGNLGFPFQQSIRNSNGQNTGGRFGLLTAHSKAHLVNANSRPLA